MSETVLAIDAGTTNVTAMIIGADGQVIGKAASPYKLRGTGPGRIMEHNHDHSHSKSERSQSDNV